jgi:ribosome maturation factor RimP
MIKKVELEEWAKAHFFIGTKCMPAYTKDAAIEKIREITERVGASEGIEVVEVELLGGGKHRILRIFIDKPSGVTHGDCEMISHNVGTILDVEDIVPAESYTLEVSSPGVERRLSKPRDFERFLGQKIKVVLREPLENQRRWEGVLAAFEGNMVTLDVATGKTVQFDLSQVDKANLKFEW